MSYHPGHAEEGAITQRNGARNGTSSACIDGDSGKDKSKARPSQLTSNKNLIGLGVVLGLQVFFMLNFELSANRLNRDLEASQVRVHMLEARLAVVEHAALACYGKLNATELRIQHESRIINEETHELRNLSSREHHEQLELRELRTRVQWHCQIGISLAGKPGSHISHA